MENNCIKVHKSFYGFFDVLDEKICNNLKCGFELMEADWVLCKHTFDMEQGFWYEEKDSTQVKQRKNDWTRNFKHIN